MVNKVIHISLGKANPNRMNGVNKVLHSLLSVQAGFIGEIEYWGISFSDQHNYPERPFKTILFRDYKSKFRLDPKLKMRIGDLKNEKNVIVHLHGAFLPQLYSISKLLVKNDVAYIFTPHGGYNLRALEKSKLLKKIYMNFIEGYVVQNAKSVQLIGASEAHGLLQYMQPKDFQIIPNGQEPLSTNYKKLEQIDKVLNIGYLGRIDIQTKGLDLILKAMKIVKDELQMKLTVIGDEGEILELRNDLISLGLYNCVDFKGALFGEAKLQALAQLDAFCLVSRNEGLPGVVLEASAVGVPSIVSEQTNMAEYINESDAGWVMTEYNEKELSSIFKKVDEEKNDGLIRTKGNNAKEMIQKVFDWKEIAKNLEELYAA